LSQVTSDDIGGNPSPVRPWRPLDID